MESKMENENPGETGVNKIANVSRALVNVTKVGGDQNARNIDFKIGGEHGWLRGLGNLLDNECARWWKTRMWLIHSLIWGSLTVFMLYQTPRAYYFKGFEPIAAWFQTLGVIVIMQGVLVGEKKDGTAAWVMSKPASRPAFILSKLIGNSLGMLATIVGLSGVIAYIFFSTAPRGAPDPISFLTALGIIFLSHLFYLTLTLMLGTLFKGYGPVIGVNLGLLLFSQMLINRIPELRHILPMPLLFSIFNGQESALLTALNGQPLDLYIPLIVIAGLECILFILISLWRFSREEF